MQHVDIAGLGAAPERSTRRPLSGPLGATDVAVDYYEVGPGEVFSGSLHAHADQEERFVVLASLRAASGSSGERSESDGVLSGTATFQLEDGSIEVGPREAVRFAPGEFQRGYNPASEKGSDEAVVAIALGAPRTHHDENAITSLVACAACGERTRHDVEVVDDAFVRTCRACGTENDPGPPPGATG